MLLRGQCAAPLELGLVAGLVQRGPDPGGDAVHVEALAAPQGCLDRLPGRRGRPEEAGRVLGVTGQQLGPGQALQGQRHRPRVPGAAGGGVGVQLQSQGGRGVAPGLRDEAQLGQDHRGPGRTVTHLAVQVEHPGQMPLSRVEVSSPARPEGEADLGVLLPEAVRLPGGEPCRTLMELLGPRQVPGQQRDPAEA